MLKPDVLRRHGAEEMILRKINDAGFEITAKKKIKLTAQQIKSLYAEYTKKEKTGEFKALLDFLTSAPVLILALKKNYALTEWSMMCGPDNPKQAKKTHPNR